MRKLPPALAAHLAGQATTVCHAWRLTRRDGTVFGFTDHDRALAFDGTAFRAAAGFDASDAETTLGLAAGMNDVAGAFSHDCITEKDLKDGRYDGARVELFLVNWQAPDEHVHLGTRELGEVTAQGTAFRAELRSLAGRLEQVQGRVYARRCDAALGDRRCGVGLSDPRFGGEGTVVAADDRSACRADGLSRFADHWFRYGLVHWTTGDNAGLSSEVADHAAESGHAMIGFWVPLANMPKPGDTFRITAGCAKTFSACRKKFANSLNFRGFPHMPGSDFAYGYADSRTVHDGRPLIR